MSVNTFLPKKTPFLLDLSVLIDYKSAYQWGTLDFATVLQTVTHLPKDKLAILTLRLTFWRRMRYLDREKGRNEASSEKY